jgi:hypothetical protein
MVIFGAMLSEGTPKDEAVGVAMEERCEWEGGGDDLDHDIEPLRRLDEVNFLTKARKTLTKARKIVHLRDAQPLVTRHNCTHRGKWRGFP